MLACSSRGSLIRIHAQICSGLSQKVHSPECIAASFPGKSPLLWFSELPPEYCQPRHASSVAQRRPSKPTSSSSSKDESPGSNIGLRSQPWSFNADLAYQKTQNRTGLARFNMQLSVDADYGRFHQCLAIAAQMKVEGIKPDILTYNALLLAASRAGLSLHAWAIFDDMELMGIRPDPTSFYHLLNAQRQKESTYMWGVLGKMNEIGVPPSSSTYSLIIARFVADGNLELALEYLNAMKARGTVPELRVAQSIIILAAQQGYPRLALDLAVSFEKESVRRLEHEAWMNCLISCTDALYAEGVVQCWGVVVQELNITPDEGLCIAVLHTAARHGLPDLATDALRVLKLLGATWQEHHFAPLIEAFCRANNLKDALVTLDIMRSNDIEPLTQTALPILNAISRDVDVVDTTWAVIDEMHKEKKRIDVSALNVIVQASVILGDLQRAVGTYKSYSDYGVKPNLDTFNFLLEGCISSSHRELGDLLLVEMKEERIKPDRDTYKNMILLCLTQDTYEDAFFYLEEMKAGNHVPPLRVYEAFVRKCASVGDSRCHIAIAEIKGCGYEVDPQLLYEVKNAVSHRPNETKNLSDTSFSGPADGSVGLDGAAQRFIETGGLAGMGTAGDELGCVDSGETAEGGADSGVVGDHEQGVIASDDKHESVDSGDRH